MDNPHNYTDTPQFHFLVFRQMAFCFPFLAISLISRTAFGVGCIVWLGGNYVQCGIPCKFNELLLFGHKFRDLFNVSNMRFIKNAFRSFKYCFHFSSQQIVKPRRLRRRIQRLVGCRLQADTKRGYIPFDYNLTIGKFSHSLDSLFLLARAYSAYTFQSSVFSF